MIIIIILRQTKEYDDGFVNERSLYSFHFKSITLTTSNDENKHFVSFPLKSGFDVILIYGIMIVIVYFIVKTSLAVVFFCIFDFLLRYNENIRR